jgi:taurine dioxygenase
MTVTEARVELKITPLSATIGAEIRGVDLKRELDERTADDLRHALLEFKVIFFPGQFLEPAEHVALGRAFGEVTPAHPVIPGIDGYPEVFEIDYTKMAQLYEQYGDSSAYRDNGVSWHTDVTFVERPPLGSILNAKVIPAAGGDTMFSNQQAAYDALSEPLQDFLETLTAVHDGTAQFAKALQQREDGGGRWEGDVYDTIVPVEHPVIRTHPETGRKSLFVNRGFTSHIPQLARPESDALLQFLYAHATQPQFTVRYHWHAGDLGFWDNRVTQHSVVGDFIGQPRVIQRITLRGDRPV